MNINKKYETVYNLLVEQYGEPKWQANNHVPPIDELVLTILSQATSDGNRDKGFAGLQEKYAGNWQAVMNAPPEEVVNAIRSAGLANQKAPRIQHALQWVYAQRGELNIDFLGNLPVAEAQKWLTQIKGVGRKTAAIIMLFAFNRPTFPVDTHVHRILKRVGFISHKVTADKAHSLMENIGDPNGYYAMHLNLIQHGRMVCQARQPKCDNCPLAKHCDYYQSLVVSR
jgi:endonuclease-3